MRPNLSATAALKEVLQPSRAVAPKMVMAGAPMRGVQAFIGDLFANKTTVLFWPWVEPSGIFPAAWIAAEVERFLAAFRSFLAAGSIDSTNACPEAWTPWVDFERRSPSLRPPVPEPSTSPQPDEASRGIARPIAREGAMGRSRSG